MRSKKPRRTILVLALGAALCVILTVVVFPKFFVDEWHLLRLKFGNADSRVAAALELGERRCTRALPALLQEIAADRRAKKTWHVEPNRYSPLSVSGPPARKIWTNSAATKALLSMGEDAEKFLERNYEATSVEPPGSAHNQVLDPGALLTLLKTQIATVTYSLQPPAYPQNDVIFL